MVDVARWSLAPRVAREFSRSVSDREDYVATSGTLHFAPRQTSKTTPVAVKADKKKEATETFFVNLSGPTNATIGGAQGIGEILDDDTPAKGPKK